MNNQMPSIDPNVIVPVYIDDEYLGFFYIETTPSNKGGNENESC